MRRRQGKRKVAGLATSEASLVTRRMHHQQSRTALERIKRNQVHCTYARVGRIENLGLVHEMHKD